MRKYLIKTWFYLRKLWHKYAIYKTKKPIQNNKMGVSNKIDSFEKIINDNTIDLNHLGNFDTFLLLGYIEMNGNYFQHYGNGKFIVIIANKIKA